MCRLNVMLSFTAFMLVTATNIFPSSPIANAEDGFKLQQSASVEIIKRALPVITEGAETWMADNDCLSCHRISFAAWSFNRALEAGFAADRDDAEKIRAWATSWKKIVNPKRREGTTQAEALLGDPDTVAQLLIGRPVIAEGSADPEWVATYRASLGSSQQEDGSWKSGGQLPLQKRPKKETQDVTTHWSLIALAATSPGKPAEDPAFVNAKPWLAAESTGTSTEWWATKLILERLTGEEATALDLRQTLLSFQNRDGGWGWLTADDSDALGTAIALYPLVQDGLVSETPAIQDAINYLGSTQNDEGGWSVNGTKKNSRDEVTETASYWAACWAIIALSETVNKNHGVTALD